MVEKSYTDAFVEAVADHLAGTPNARHPVQFHSHKVFSDVRICTFCHAFVDDEDGHRRWHDRHNAEHARINREAHEYREPPRYGS